MREQVQFLSLIIGAVVCCMLPLALVGGVSLVSGMRWREPFPSLIGVVVVTVALGWAASGVARRRRGF